MNARSQDLFAGVDVDLWQIFVHNPLPMWVYDTQTLRMLAVNPVALKSYGYREEDFLALSLPDLHADDELERLHKNLRLPLIERVAQRAWRHRQRSGELMHVEIVTQDLHLGNIPARMVMVNDLSGKLREEQALHEERETLAAVINASADAIVSVDLSGEIQMFNPGAERLFGRSRQSMQGRSIDLLLPPDVRAKHPQFLRRFAEQGLHSRELGADRPVRAVRSDGRELALQATLSKVDLGRGPLLIACLRDVTERLRLNAESQRSREQLSELTQRLMTQERTLVKGVAQTLHDHLGQTMAAIRMTHETVLTLQNAEAAVVSVEVGRLQGHISMLIGQAITQIRRVLVDLRPPLLEEQGFAAAIENELRHRALSQPQIAMVLRVAPASAQIRWAPDVEYAAFMVAREALENALRHSGSPSIRVYLSGCADVLELEVVDDGFGMAELAPERQARHLGILGMHERAQAIGARVSVTSAPGLGTQVRFSWSRAP